MMDGSASAASALLSKMARSAHVPADAAGGEGDNDDGDAPPPRRSGFRGRWRGLTSVLGAIKRTPGRHRHTPRGSRVASIDATTDGPDAAADVAVGAGAPPSPKHSEERHDTMPAFLANEAAIQDGRAAPMALGPATTRQLLDAKPARAAPAAVATVTAPGHDAEA